MTEATATQTSSFDSNPELDQAVELRLRPDIRPRSDWAGSRAPTGPLAIEDDVRFLLVHHTASDNDYGPDEVVDQIVDFYDFHIGPERGWSDLAYNFVIDRFGGIWEARQGSIEDPMQGDATGGSQGYAQLCSLIGNHVDVPPTTEAIDSLTRLLAWLAHRYRIDTAAGSTVQFSSRGSTRWPTGTDVTARTISGHRDMSVTSCPGETVYNLLDTTIPERIGLLRQTALDEARAELGLGSGSDAEADDEADADAARTESQPGVDESPTTATISSESVAVDDIEAPGDAAGPTIEADGDGGTDAITDNVLVSVGVTMVVGGLAGLIALRRRRVQS